MQQNDLPTSLSIKWYFLLHSIEQINQLTVVALGSNRLTWLKEFIKQHTLHVPLDAQKDFLGMDVWLSRGCCWLSGVYPRICVCLGLSYIIHLSSPVTIFHKKFFLRCLASSEMHGLNWWPMLFSGSSYGTHFPSLRIFPISCNRLETVALSTANCYASTFRVCDGFSSNNDFKASVFAVRGIPERCRSLTSNSPVLKRRIRYLQVLWDTTHSTSTDHIDSHASAAFFPCWNS
uniref:Uncharacterized protein n=1 Tax=Heterorhabditis bacteriophora TaxID=37862 RepID=A0A1I7WIN0_HETBA